MKMKFGAIVVAGSGKIGGHVASKNRGGAYLRTKVTPANARTVFQAAIRATFTSLSQGWRGLTEAQRIAWNAAVGDFAKTDIFGDLRNPSGANLYQKLNNNLISIGEALIDLPPAPSAVASCIIGIVTNATVAGTMTFAFDPVIPVGTKVKVFATAPMSAGKFFVKSEYRQIAVLDDGDMTPYDIQPKYVAKFGSQGEIGEKIFIKLVPINSTTGQAGGNTSAYVIAVA